MLEGGCGWSIIRDSMVHLLLVWCQRSGDERTLPHKVPNGVQWCCQYKKLGETSTLILDDRLHGDTALSCHGELPSGHDRHWGVCHTLWAQAAEFGALLWGSVACRNLYGSAIVVMEVRGKSYRRNRTPSAGTNVMGSERAGLGACHQCSASRGRTDSHLDEKKYVRRSVSWLLRSG